MLLEEMTWVKSEEYFKENDMIIIPIGSLECHGKHMPLGTDFLIPNKIIELFREKNDNVMIAPTIPYGSCESLYEFSGTVNLGLDLFYNLVKKIIENFKSHGAKKFVILNGHGGNIKALERIGYELDSVGCKMAILNWWLNVWEMDEKWKGGHGGGEETAGIMAVNPDLIDRTYIDEPLVLKDLSSEIKGAGFNTVKYKGITVTVPRLTNNVTDNGWIGPDHPKFATEEWGNNMLNAFTEFMLDFVDEFNKVEL